MEIALLVVGIVLATSLGIYHYRLGVRRRKAEEELERLYEQARREIHEHGRR